MDSNYWVLQEIEKFHKEDMERNLKFNETYKIYSTTKKKHCINLKIIKFCL